MSSLFRTQFKYYYQALAGLNIVSTKPGILHSITITETAASQIAIYDDAAGLGSNTITVLAASIPEGTYTFNAQLANGLTVIAAGNSKFTIAYE